MALSAKKIVLYSFIVIALCGGVAVYMIDAQQKHQTHIETEKARVAREEAAKEYEDVLNGFIEEIKQEVKAYKTQRMIIRELTEPLNFEKPEYAEENHETFKTQIIPALEAQAQKALGVFDATGVKIDEILKEKSEETRQFIRAKWQEMRDRELGNYRTFFEADRRVLTAYEELLQFYARKSGAYKVVNDAFVFDNPADQKAEQDLLMIIKMMQKPDQKQKPVLAKETPPPVSADKTPPAAQ